MSNSPNGNGAVTTLKGMYEDYFLDYASYVILERAVPSIEDGLKPVQRRILHSMKQMDDGRYHKVANIIGQTMQYHPHGDAAIGDALVNLGQKDLLIDTQGNWGDNRTGDSAAAPRYIEARLTKFALEVAFNAHTTEWQLSYDGRKKEPITLPMKFPLLLAQGAEGIAVGLSTKILPHNFIELIRNSIKILEGKKPRIYPDFQTGGFIDVSDYNGGKRGGKVRVRSKIEQLDKKSLIIRELPYGVSTTSLIDSIIKANDKGKIKIKKVVDNTAKDVEVVIELATGVSPDVTIDALYAFTNCEVSISPNACIIIDDKPHFLNVNEVLITCTEQTKNLLGRELEIKLGDLQESWHMASLEKIFIEKRIYRDIEECETWEAVLMTIGTGLHKYVATPSDKALPSDKRIRLMRDITHEDIVRLTEIKIKRISKYNTFKHDELIEKLEEGIKEVQYDLEHLTEYAIRYYQNLLKKYGKGKERKTEITQFEQIQAAQVIANNTKLYVSRKEGFIGWGLRKDEFVKDCSDIDDIIVFKKDGTFQVTRITEKTFVGKNIVHVDVWKRGDERTTYNLMYVDTKSGKCYAKRFNVKSITREKDYDLTTGSEGNKILYFSANPNGEAEKVSVQLSQGCRARIKIFDFDFGDLDIKGRGSRGNTVTKYPVRKVSQLEIGKSTLGAVKFWMDEVSGRLNKDERGIFLGDFDTGDNILAIFKDGSYEIVEFDMNKHFNTKELVVIEKFDPKKIISAVYYDGAKGWTMVKRFLVETTSLNQRFTFITDLRSSKLMFASTKGHPRIEFAVKKKKRKVKNDLVLSEFVDVKGWKSLGNKLADTRVIGLTELDEAIPDMLHTGDTIEFDF